MPSPLSPSLVDVVEKQDHEPLAMKQCSKCRAIKLVSQFYKRKNSRDGLQGICKSCYEEKNTRWEKQNPVKMQTAYMTCSARYRAKSRGLKFNIDTDYVRSLVTSHCPVLGVPLEWSCCRDTTGRPLPNSPSLDRIDPSKGYVRGNVWIISNKANIIKSNATHEELRLVTEAVGRAIVDSLDW